MCTLCPFHQNVYFYNFCAVCVDCSIARVENICWPQQQLYQNEYTPREMKCSSRRWRQNKEHSTWMAALHSSYIPYAGDASTAARVAGAANFASVLSHAKTYRFLSLPSVRLSGRCDVWTIKMSQSHIRNRWLNHFVPFAETKEKKIPMKGLRVLSTRTWLFAIGDTHALTLSFEWASGQWGRGISQFLSSVGSSKWVWLSKRDKNKTKNSIASQRQQKCMVQWFRVGQNGMKKIQSDFFLADSDYCFRFGAFVVQHVSRMQKTIQKSNSKINFYFEYFATEWRSRFVVSRPNAVDVDCRNGSLHFVWPHLILELESFRVCTQLRSRISCRT